MDTGISTARTTACIISPANLWLRIKNAPAPARVATFGTGQPIFISIHFAPLSAKIRAASAINSTFAPKICVPILPSALYLSKLRGQFLCCSTNE